MKKASLIILVGAASFFLGFTLKTVLTQQQETHHTTGITGIGGIFFKCKDPNAMKDWYKTHLGLNATQYGAKFKWYQDSAGTKKGTTTWSPFKETTKYFDPSTKDFMINYRVEGLEALVEQLKNDRVTIVDKIEASEYGKFVHIMDIEGNKVELWEPTDSK